MRKTSKWRWPLNSTPELLRSVYITCHGYHALSLDYKSFYDCHGSLKLNITIFPQFSVEHILVTITRSKSKINSKSITEFRKINIIIILYILYYIIILIRETFFSIFYSAKMFEIIKHFLNCKYFLSISYLESYLT